MKDINTLTDLVIIDIREKNKYFDFHLNNSINIPFTSLLINMNYYLDKNKNYLLICESGLKSKKTSIILNNNGYKTYSLKGGIKSLQ